MEKSKKALPIVLASTLLTTPLVVAPQTAHAIDNVNIDADDDTAGEDSEYTIEFTTEEVVEKGDYIYIKFPSEYDISKSIGTSDVDVDGYDVKSVKASGQIIQIRMDEEIDSDEDVTVTISDGITNPDDEDSYEIGVSTTSEKYVYGDVDINEDGKSSNSSKSDNFDVALDTDAAGEKTSIELGDFDLKSRDELGSGDEITVTFPDKKMLPSDMDESDVKLNGSAPKSVEVDGDKVLIKVPSSKDGDDYINIEFLKSAGIKNPSSGDYTFKVKYDGTTYTSEKVKIKSSGSSSSSSSSDFSVSLSDPTAGARSSYSFEADFGSKELKPDTVFTVELPSADMIPGFLSPSDFTINGKIAKKVSASGSKLYITTPSNFSKDSSVKVNISFTAWISNPKTAGSYDLKMTVDGKSLTSKSFSITGSSVNPLPPTPTNPTTPTTPTVPAPVNNSTATIGLTNTALGKPTGVNISIKGLGVGLAKQRDFIELVFPAGYRVPAYIAPANITVNGVAANYVAVRGQNVLIYPTQDIPAATAANIAINAAANIVNPSVKNAYSISVFTSEEKGLQFARAVGVGMPAPAQPTTPPVNQTPQQPSANVPTNAALFKVNVANFTLHGKTYPLEVAPYLANGNTTMVPAQFFKEALALTTQWNNQTVAVISGTKVLRMTVGSNKAKIGSQEVTLPAPVVLKNGMPMIPVRFVTDNLGYKVGWDAKTSSVFVYR